MAVQGGPCSRGDQQRNTVGVTEVDVVICINHRGRSGPRAALILPHPFARRKLNALWRTRAIMTLIQIITDEHGAAGLGSQLVNADKIDLLGLHTAAARGLQFNCSGKVAADAVIDGHLLRAVRPWYSAPRGAIVPDCLAHSRYFWAAFLYCSRRSSRLLSFSKGVPLASLMARCCVWMALVTAPPAK